MVDIGDNSIIVLEQIEKRLVGVRKGAKAGLPMLYAVACNFMRCVQ